MNHKKSIFVVFVTVFVDLVGFGIIIPMSPYLATQFGGDAFQVGFLMAIYSIMQFLFSPFWGQLSDRFGRRPIILMSLAGAAVSHFAFAFAGEYWILVAARCFAGIFAANISASMAYIADVTEKKDRSKGMGLIGAAFGLGFVFGPFLGGAFTSVGKFLGSVPPFGESFPAIVASIICFANFIFAVFVLKESLSPELRTKSSPSFAKGHASRFLNIKQYLGNPKLAPVYAIFFLMSFAMAHMEASMFLYVMDKWSWSLMKASFGFAYVGIIIVFTQGWLIRKIIPKWGERFVLVLGLVVMAAGFFGIGFSDSIAVLAISVTLLGLGNGMASPSTSGSLSLLASDRQQGSVMGVAHSLSAMGRIVGPLTGGLVYRDWFIESPFYLASLFVCFGVIIAVKVYSDLPREGLSRAK